MAEKESKIKFGRHTDFEKMSPYYTKWDDLIEGGAAIEKNETAYLIQHPWETDKQYKIRVDRSTYRNYASPISSVFHSSIWRKEETRTLPAALDAIQMDVDMNGASAENFFRDVSRGASDRGIEFVLVDSNTAPEGEKVESLGDQKRLNIRPYFQAINALMVVDWFIGDDGMLDWVVIMDEIDNPRPEPFTKTSTKTRYRVWYRDRFEVYHETKTDDGKTMTTLEREGVNKIGEVPLVPFHFKRLGLMTGASSIADVDSLLINIYRTQNELGKSLFDTAIPILHFAGFTPEELADFVRASSSGVRSDEAEAMVRYVEPLGRAFRDIRQQIADDQSAVREIALRNLRPESRQIESPESKKLDKIQLDSLLAKFSKNTESAEKRCWELAAKWANTEAGDIDVSLNKDFDIMAIDAALIGALSNMAERRQVSIERVWEVLKQAEIRGFQDIDPVEERARIENESRTTPTGITTLGQVIGAATGAGGE